MFSIPLASGPSQAIFQSKVNPAIQGRVFAIRGMISRSMMPLAFLIAGPLADFVFEPLLSSNGILASSFVGLILGTGPGRGVGLMFIISGITGILASVMAFLNPRIRNVESELPDALLDEAATSPAVSPVPLTDTSSAD
jgi:MFS transporter, DHA3 family, macrolide efflux protein